MEIIAPRTHTLRESERIVINCSGNPIIDQHAITPKGVQFLFLSQHSQIWEIVLFYLMYLSSQDMKINALRLLFRLSFMTIGHSYPTGDFTHEQCTIIQDLHDIGLVYYRSQEQRVYPTRLILNLSGISNIVNVTSAYTTTNDSRTTSTDGTTTYLHVPKYIVDDGCQIIIETSFKVHAFTRSPLMIAILSFIVDFTYRLPNVVMGYINRKSIRRALLNNLHSSTIVQWLHEHLHPLMFTVGTNVLTTSQQQLPVGITNSTTTSTGGVGTGADAGGNTSQEHFSINTSTSTSATSGTLVSNELLSGTGSTSNALHTNVSLQRKYIPKNVISQIELWEEERLRFQLQDAVLLKDFHSSQEYSMWYAYVEKKKLLLFHDAERQLLVVTPAGFDSIVREKHRIEGKVAHLG
uniref:General transcription factor IIH subunit 4 n=3 Tax=Lygus hesperus TaxID=30085 RepID=A0A146LL03_LYGHE